MQYDDFESIITAIDAYRSERALSGRGFQAHKNYFGDGHLPFVRAHRMMISSQRRANEHHIGYLRQLTHDFYDRQQIESELNQLSLSIMSLNALILAAPLTVPVIAVPLVAPLAASVATNYLRNLLDTRLERQRVLREKRDQLATYEANTRFLYVGVEAQMLTVRRNLTRLEMQTKCPNTGVVYLPTVAYETLDALQAALAPLPAEDRIAILQIVMNAPEEYRALFFAVADQIHIGCMNSSGVFFAPNVRYNWNGEIVEFERATIKFNLANDQENVRGAYFTFFHEVGHLIDWALTDNSELFTRGEPHRDPLFTALNNDVRNQLRTVAAGLEMPGDIHSPMQHLYREQAIENIMSGRVSSCQFQQSLQDEMNRILLGNDPRFAAAHPDLDQTRNNMVNPSNIYEGVTNNVVHGWWTHTRPDRQHYWFREDGSVTYSQNSEFFANHFANATLNNEEALAAEEFYFPTASEMLTTTIIPDMTSRLGAND